MARILGGFARSAGTSGRSGGGISVTWINARDVQDRMSAIADGLAWDDDGNLLSRKTAANRELRAAAKGIAERLLIPQMKRTARSSPTPQARAMAETARARSDRVVSVQVGGVNPPLRGFKRGRGVKRAAGRTAGSGRDATSRTYRTTLAWGSEFGPKGGRRRPSRGNNIPAGPVNHYKAARNEKGYWVLPAVLNVLEPAKQRFAEAIDDVIAKYTGGWR